jgi:hypothetical protein
MAILTEREARRIGARLQHWSARPIRQANARALGLCIIAFVVTMVAASHSAEPVMAIRAMAVMFVAVQGAVHYLSIAGLRSLVELGVKEAEFALNIYRDPRRISGLDLAMVWTAIALIVPYFQ